MPDTEAQCERTSLWDEAGPAHPIRPGDTARAFIRALVDDGSFVETEPDRLTHHTGLGLGDRRVPGDGVVTGFALIDGRPIAVFSHDPRVMGGAMGEVFSQKIARIMDAALTTGCPVVGINASGGARIQEGVSSLAGIGEVFYRNVLASGLVPQISVIVGTSAGGAAYSPALTDFIIMAESAKLVVTGPRVVKAVMGEEVSLDELGGAWVHSRASGLPHLVAKDAESSLLLARRLLSYLPQDATTRPPRGPVVDPPDRPCHVRGVVPEDPKLAYDVRAVIERIADEGSFLELQAAYAMNIVVGFARLHGWTVGVVANQPQHLAGCLDIDASDKGARFVRTCDAFNIPVVTLVDVPGFLPGRDQEHGGILRHGAKLVYAYAESTVPKLTVILRKAFGGAYIAMGSRHLRADHVLAWPTAQIAVMGAEGAVDVIYKRKLDSAQDRDALREELVAEYEHGFLNPWAAAERGYVDDVIDPEETRVRLITLLSLFSTKRQSRPAKKHGNMPV